MVKATVAPVPPPMAAAAALPSPRGPQPLAEVLEALPAVWVWSGNGTRKRTWDLRACVFVCVCVGVTLCLCMCTLSGCVEVCAWVEMYAWAHACAHLRLDVSECVRERARVVYPPPRRRNAGVV